MKSLLELCEVELENGCYSEYVGINILNGKPEVVFPRGYKLCEDSIGLRKDVILLLKVLDKYQSRKESRMYMQDDKNLLEGNGKYFPFSKAIWLIVDYENNGLYKNYVNSYKTDKNGKINWNKTIKNKMPYINNENQFVYLDFIIKEIKNDSSNIVRLIQKFILEICIDNIGWLYPGVSVEKGNKLPYSVNGCINILRKELRVCNIDSKKQLIRNMIEFLQYVGQDKSNNSMKEYKTKYFMNIWEDMIRLVFGNDDEREYYTKATWSISGKEVEASSLRPDVIMKLDNIVYILDAKYYKYGITKSVSDLPQSSDIGKQLLYSSYISSNKGYKAYDAFILPFKAKDQVMMMHCCNASISMKGYENKNVVAILIDMKKIMRLYISNNSFDIYKENLRYIIDKNNM